MHNPLPDAELRAYVNDIIHMLELEDVADVLVGTGENGLPVGERKRYTIGVELVTNPSVLFLGECGNTDECCSGRCIGDRDLLRSLSQTSPPAAWTAAPRLSSCA